MDSNTKQTREDSVDLTVDIDELTHEQLREEEARILEELANYHPTRDDSVDLTVDIDELTHEQLREEEARILEELANYHPTSAAPRGRRIRSCCASRPRTVG